MQTQSTATGLSLKKLKGIKSKGVKSRIKTSVEDLVIVCDNFVNEHKRKELYFNAMDPNSSLNKVKEECHELVKPLMDTFSQDDLNLFVGSRSQQDYGSKEAKLVGLFSGVLLDELMNLYEQNNKPKQFYLNGQNINFHHLFFFATNFDALIIDSVQGNEICSHAKHDKENNCLISIVNCDGNYLGDGALTNCMIKLNNGQSLETPESYLNNSFNSFSIQSGHSTALYLLNGNNSYGIKINLESKDHFSKQALVAKKLGRVISQDDTKKFYKNISQRYGITSILNNLNKLNSANDETKLQLADKIFETYNSITRPKLNKCKK